MRGTRFTPTELGAHISALVPSHIVLSNSLAARLIDNRHKGSNEFDNFFEFTNEHLTHGTKIGVLLGVDVVINRFYADDVLEFHCDGGTIYQLQVIQ